MAITSARIQVKRGNEVDFDAEKMLVGEWALSTDKRIVRICVAPNVCIRMATYDAFEVDMAKIEKILEECQAIEDAVELINSQVSEKLQATIEYTNQAKQYRDETEQFRNEVESMVDIGIATTERAGIVKPDGITIRVDEDGTIHADNGTVDYNELENKPSINGMELSGDKSLDELGIASVEALEETNSKVNIIIDKAELNIKNTASGENIHLTDSANGKNVGFGLYGKAEQKQYSGKNLLENTAESQTVNGVTFTVNEDGSVTVNGTATSNAFFALNPIALDGKYIMSGCPSNAGNYWMYGQENSVVDTGNGITFEYSGSFTPVIRINGGITVSNLTFYPMIRLASITDGTFEPYVGGIASPSPDYPQEITVSGSDGSVEVKSVGKNLLKNTLTSYTVGNVVFATNEDGTVNVNGQTSDVAISSLSLCDMELTEGSKYILSGGVSSSVRLFIYYKEDYTKLNVYSNGNDASFTVPITGIYRVCIRVYENTTVANALIKPMLRLPSDTDSTFEPYTETTSTIPTPDGLCGIKVSSGGNYVDENGQQWICDEVVKYADSSGKRIQRIGKAVFDGSDDEEWFLYETIYYSIPKTSIANYNLPFGAIDMLSSHFTISVDGAVIGKMWVGNSYINFNFDNGVMGVEEFKTWLSTDNVELYYPLATPIITDLSAEEIAEIEKLHTFYPITNISNDADCGMSITYMADAKNYIDNRLALIESAMLNNI